MNRPHTRRPALPWAALTAMAVVLAAAQPSQAAVMQAVFSGVIDGAIGGDAAADMFGLAPGQTLGQAFTMTFRYDTALGVLSAGGDLANLEGGPLEGTTSPILSAQVTINGVTQSLDALALGSLNAQDASKGGLPFACMSASGAAVEGVGGFDENPAIQACVQKAGAPISIDFTQPYALHGAGASFLPSVIHLIRTGGDGVHAAEELDLLGAATDVVVTRVSGAPEPAAWALMIAGFGLAGSRLRSRRRGLAAA